MARADLPTRHPHAQSPLSCRKGPLCRTRGEAVCVCFIHCRDKLIECLRDLIGCVTGDVFAKRVCVHLATVPVGALDEPLYGLEEVIG